MTDTLYKAPDLDASFWAEAFTEKYLPLCSLARRTLTKGNLSDAEDAVSEAFVRGMRYSKRPQAIANLSGYLWTITKRAWVAKLIREKVAKTDSLDDPKNDALINKLPATEIESDLLTILENTRLRDEMRVKQGDLSEREFLLFTRHLEGFTAAEIALELNEDVRITRSDLNAVRNKVHYRVTKANAMKKSSSNT